MQAQSASFNFADLLALVASEVPTRTAIVCGDERITYAEFAARVERLAAWLEHHGLRAGDTLAAHARFVIGGALVTPPPDRLVNLDLQNGPDAVRLVWPDGASEVLGWGDLTFDEYHCGAPAPDVPSGRALARIPEDAGDADNRTAFREGDPTPGAANVRRRDAALVPHALALEPEQPAVGAEAVLALRAVVPLHTDSRTTYLAIVVILSCVGWSSVARLVRAQTIAMRPSGFLLAAEALGASRGDMRHVLPNVLGMAVYADGGRMATKPYASGGAYIDKMSDYCKGCTYDRKARVGDRACPFTTLYWDFLDRHHDRFVRNARVATQARAARKLTDLPEVRARAVEVRTKLLDGTL